MTDLFTQQLEGRREALGRHSWVLHGFALRHADGLLQAIDAIVCAAPWRHMTTPGGYTMSVESCNCGALGWVTDRRGYRYVSLDPLSGRPWPPMPELFEALALDAAREAGFAAFIPDACLLNRYAPGARMSLHQDENERDMSQPIVSVSLGMSAVFQFGGMTRDAPVSKVLLEHGDVVVWGGEDRLRFHGIMPLKGQPHERLGNFRVNLTMRKAG